MSNQLLACPFCRELFSVGEASVCPQCDMALRPLADLPPSHDVREETALEWERTPPQDRTLPWLYMPRGRGALALIGVLGIASAFCPWVHLTKPNVAVLSGIDLMRSRGFWFGGALVAWMVMVPLVATRRSITRMRGVRIILCFFALTPLCQALLLYTNAPTSRLIPLEFHWGFGFLANAVLGVIALPFAATFGGRIDDLPADLGKELVPFADSETSAGETLH